MIYLLAESGYTSPKVSTCKVFTTLNDLITFIRRCRDADLEQEIEEYHDQEEKDKSIDVDAVRTRIQRLARQTLAEYIEEDFLSSYSGGYLYFLEENSPDLDWSRNSKVKATKFLNHCRENRVETEDRPEVDPMYL